MLHALYVYCLLFTSVLLHSASLFNMLYSWTRHLFKLTHAHITYIQVLCFSNLLSRHCHIGCFKPLQLPWWFLADCIRSRLCHSMSSVVCLTFCIAAKRYVLAKNCLKEQIGLPPETTPRYQVGPPIPPLTGIIPYKRFCLFPYIRVWCSCLHCYCHVTVYKYS